MRNAVKHGALVLFSVLLCMLALEGAIRLYSAFSFPRMMQLDDRLGWKHTPNVSKLFENELGERVEIVQNVYGHRGPARPLARTPGKYRILVLGDSFTEGVQVGESDLFTALLERNDSRIEALNAGVGGYGTVQEYLYLEQEGLKHNPDLVLLMVYDNDLADNCLAAYPAFGPKPYAVRRNGTVEIVEKLDAEAFRKYSIPVPFAEALNKHSYLFYFLNTSIYQRLRGDQMRAHIKADMAAAEACGKQEVIAALMDKMHNLVTSKGARFAAVLIPSRDDVRKGASPTMQAIGDFCQRRGLNCLSLLERLARDMESAQPYFANDIHWTRAGHRIAAEEIGRFLHAIGALPARAQDGGGGG